MIATARPTPHTADFPCPVCRGHEGLPRGHAERCYGFTTADGWTHCTRPEYAEKAKHYPTSNTYAHRTVGRCPCGVEHAPDPAGNGQPNGKPKGKRKGKRKVVATFFYTDETGTCLYRVQRVQPKDFYQNPPDGNGGWKTGKGCMAGVRLVPYRLPDLLAADPSIPVLFAEGEKDVDRLRAEGFTATCNVAGAGKWRDEYSPLLAGRHVVILPDNDKAGRQHAEQVARSVSAHAASVKVVELHGLPEKGDVSDWLNVGGTAAELREIIEAAPAWKPRGEDVVPAALPAMELICNSKGRALSCAANSREWLEKSRETPPQYDTFRRMVLLDGAPLTDQHIVDLTIDIERSLDVPWCQEHIRSAIQSIAHQHQFSSLQEYLDSLSWDGEDRIEHFFSDHYECDRTPYHAEVGRIFFLSAVARAYTPGCKVDTVPVLIGRQGCGKSRGIAALCPVDEWFSDDIGNDMFAGKAGEGLQAKWIIELAELARVNRSTIEVVKSFISRQTDRYRPAYGRIAQDYPRTCVFVATTNDDQPLQDTENRRYLPVRVGTADPDVIASVRDQLWAEAVVRFKAGENWWITRPHLIAEANEQGEAARAVDAWEAILREKLGCRTRTTVVEAATILEIPAERLDKSKQTRIGLALSEIGFERKRGPRPLREWFYEREVAPP